MVHKMINMYFTIICVLIFVTNSFQAQPNVLLIVVDDLRPNLGVYNYKNAFTPNIDRLAKKSVVFNNAFAQQALCAPSRNSFLTSRRPDSVKLYDFYSYWRDVAGNFTTLPQYFKENGYQTHSVGKIFHPGISSNFTDDAKYSWSDAPYHPPTEKYKESKVCPTDSGTLARNLICPVIVDQQPEGSLPDLESQRAALEFLENRKNSVENKPFFLAVGFHKPHIPIKFPIQYLKLHPLENITLPAVHRKLGTLPSVAWNPWTDVRRRDDIAALNLGFPFGTMPDDMIKKIIQAYNAAVSYIDDLIGELLQTVDDDTIIVLTSDHGWSLGENGEFSKFSNFGTATRVPLIIHVPKLTTQNKIIKTDSLVELVDLFPTLVELIGSNLAKCPKNSSKIKLCTEGRSLVPLIVSAVQGKAFKGKQAIFHQYPRPGLFPTQKPNSDKPRLKEIKIMGYSIRTDQFRYTEWVEFDHDNFIPNWDNVQVRELYDITMDPDENMNLSTRNDLDDVMSNLSRQLRLGWSYVQ